MSRARDLRRNQTTAEQKLWSRLRDRQLAGYKFKRQVPRGSYVVDFACLRERLIVELDGGQHADPLRRAKDRVRSAWLEANGYRVLRFWNNEVRENNEGVLVRIEEALGEQKPPHPPPSPRGGEGVMAVPLCQKASLAPLGRGLRRLGEAAAEPSRSWVRG